MSKTSDMLKKYGTLFAVVVMAVVLAGGGLLAMMSGGALGSFAGSDGDQGTKPVDRQKDQEQKDTKGPWEDRLVKKRIAIETPAGNAITSGTIHVFDEKPTDSNGNVVWGNARTIEIYYGSSQEMEQVAISGERTTLQYKPGTYYLAIENSSYYTQFVKVTIPDGSSYDIKLSSYNKNPETLTVSMPERYNPSLTQVDVGIDKTTSSIQDWKESHTVKPAEGSRYKVWKMVVETGTVDMTTDSNDDGEYDEGIRKFYVTVSGAGLSSEKSKVFFNPSNGIDRLGDDGKATFKLDSLVAKPSQPLTYTTHFTTFATGSNSSNAADGDETFTDSEHVANLQFFDDSGQGTGEVQVVG